MISKIENLLAKFLEKNFYPKTIILSFLLLIFRSYERAIIPNLWAEDGTLFLSDFINKSFSSFFESYAGYFHTIPRLITAIIYLILPIQFYPLALFLVCTLLTSFVLSEIVREDYSSIFESKIQRFFLALLFTFLPGLNEILGNLANIHWICFLYFAISLLREKKYSWNLFDFIILFLITGSAGETVVLIPILFIRIFLVYVYKEEKILFIKNLILFLFLFGFFILNYTKKLEHPEGKFQSFEEIFLGIKLMALNFFVYQPILGDRYLSKLYNNYRTIYFVLGYLSFTSIFGFLIYKKIFQKNFLIPILFATFLIPILTFIVRPGTLYTYLYLDGIWKYRYSFTLSYFGLFLFILLIQQMKSKNWKLYFFIFFFLFYIFNSRYRYKIEAYDKDLNWYEDAKLLKKSMQTGCPNEVRIKITPKKENLAEIFYFGYKSDLNKNCDEL